MNGNYSFRQKIKANMLNQPRRSLDSDSANPVAKLLCCKVAHYSDKKAQSPKGKVQRYPQITQITQIEKHKGRSRKQMAAIQFK